MSRTDASSSRRTFLKKAGITSLGASALLSGCLGGGGGGGSGGSGGSGGGGGSTGGQQLERVNITLAPDGIQGIMMDYITEDTSILADAMEAEGYEARVQTSWEGAALFAAGGPDFETMSSLESTRLGAERDMNIAVFAKVAPLYMGWWTEKGGRYDPENTGGTAESIRMLAEDDATVGIGAWSGGDVPGYTMVLGQAYDYQFGEEQSDFNVTTAEYNAIPQLILRGQLDAGGSSPIHGVSRHIDENGDPQHAEIFSAAAALDEAGIGVPPLNNLVTTREFIEENEGAATALLQSWHQGMEWFYDDPIGAVEEDEDEHLEQLGVNTMAQAQYLLDWGVNMEYDNEYPYNYLDQELTDDFIAQDRGFLNNAVEAGFVPENWEEHVTYHKLPQA